MEMNNRFEKIEKYKHFLKYATEVKIDTSKGSLELLPEPHIFRTHEGIYILKMDVRKHDLISENDMHILFSNWDNPIITTDDQFAVFNAVLNREYGSLVYSYLLKCYPIKTREINHELSIKYLLR